MKLNAFIAGTLTAVLFGFGSAAAQAVTTDNQLVITYDASESALEIGRVDKWTKLNEAFLSVTEVQFDNFDDVLMKLEGWHATAKANNVRNFEKSLRLLGGKRGATTALDFNFTVDADGSAMTFVSSKFGTSCDNVAGGSSFGCMNHPGFGVGIIKIDDIADIREVLADMDAFKAQGSTDDLFK